MEASTAFTCTAILTGALTIYSKRDVKHPLVESLHFISLKKKKQLLVTRRSAIVSDSTKSKIQVNSDTLYYTIYFHTFMYTYYLISKKQTNKQKIMKFV